jgi:hypothetical protein
MLLLGLDAAGKSDAAVMVNYCLDWNYLNIPVDRKKFFNGFQLDP